MTCEFETFLVFKTLVSVSDKVDSDSSHYESYGEEDDEEFVKDRAHYIHWSTSQPCLRPVPESRICGYLWRKKWLGQWTRQLFIIKHNSLLVRRHPNPNTTLKVLKNA